mmetsp:Transcript_2496/g.5727  ORF Transcript_2496/g.5727 Transcript_2496/m.5727 type:complete len:217 (+) Transcript_2496:30-680(+)
MKLAIRSSSGVCKNAKSLLQTFNLIFTRCFALGVLCCPQIHASRTKFLPFDDGVVQSSLLCLQVLHLIAESSVRLRKIRLRLSQRRILLREGLVGLFLELGEFPGCLSFGFISLLDGPSKIGLDHVQHPENPTIFLLSSLVRSTEASVRSVVRLLHKFHLRLGSLLVKLGQNVNGLLHSLFSFSCVRHCLFVVSVFLCASGVGFAKRSGELGNLVF